MSPFQEHERRLELDRTYYRDPPASHGWRHPDTGQVFGVGELAEPVGDTYDPSLPTWQLLGRPDLAVTPERKTA